MKREVEIGLPPAPKPQPKVPADIPPQPDLAGPENRHDYLAALMGFQQAHAMHMDRMHERAKEWMELSHKYRQEAAQNGNS